MGETALEREKRLKKQDAEFNEKLDIVGQENERKAAGAIKEILNDKEKKRRAHRHYVLNQLDDLRRNATAYKRRLREIIDGNIQVRTELPLGYRAGSRITPKGIVIELKTPLLKTFTRAFAPRYDAEYDLAAVDIILTQMDNTIDKLEGGDHGRKINIGGTGIIIPDTK